VSMMCNLQKKKENGGSTTSFSLSSLINFIPTQSQNTLLMSNYHRRMQLLLVHVMSSTCSDRWTITTGSLEQLGIYYFEKNSELLNMWSD
jgi:hypothetical protein